MDLFYIFVCEPFFNKISRKANKEMRRKIKKWKGKLNVIFCQNCPGMGGGRRRRVEREIEEFKNVGKVIFVM